MKGFNIKHSIYLDDRAIWTDVERPADALDLVFNCFFFAAFTGEHVLIDTDIEAPNADPGHLPHQRASFKLRSIGGSTKLRSIGESHGCGGRRRCHCNWNGESAPES